MHGKKERKQKHGIVNTTNVKKNAEIAAFPLQCDEQISVLLIAFSNWACNTMRCNDEITCDD